MRTAQVAGGIGALLAMSALVLHTSTAAFTATTESTGNTWAAGTVVLSDDDSGTAMFAESGLAPGDTGSRCITVTYDGDLAAQVELYGAVTGGTGLGDHLDLTVQRGAAVPADCTGFTAVETVYTGTLTGFTTDHTSFGTGAGSWAPTGAGQSVSYRFVWTLQDDNAAQGKDVSASFTWEAQST